MVFAKTRDGRNDSNAANDDRNVLTETSGELFPSGAMLELVRSSDDQIQLAHWDGSSASICPRVDLDGKAFVPAALDHALVKEIELPSSAADFGSTAALFDNLRCLFQEHPGLSEGNVWKAAFSALATWFSECGAPCLLVTSPDSSASRLLLDQLRCVCRRSINVSDVTRNGLWSLPLWLHPTVIIDQPKTTKELLRVARAMSRPGVRIPRNGRLLDVFCPIVICTEDPTSDSWLLENSIQIELMPTATRCPRIAPLQQRKISRELQAKLLSYRFKNFSRVQQSEFDAPQFSFPTRATARNLGACVIDDRELQSRVISLLAQQDEDARVRRTTKLDAIVIETGLLFCHEKKKRESAYVSEFATVANAILENRGESVKLEPRAIGDILRSLGLFSRRLDRAGRGILLLREVRDQIHQLAWRFGVRSIEDGVDRCEFCTQARAQFGDSIQLGCERARHARCAR